MPTQQPTPQREDMARYTSEAASTQVYYIHEETGRIFSEDDLYERDPQLLHEVLGSEKNILLHEIKDQEGDQK